MERLKYNYVIFGSSDDYYLVSYSELYSLEGVHCVMDGIDTRNEILRLLYKIHTSKKTQEIVNLPFKSLWNNSLFRHSFPDEKPICFIFFSRNTACNPQVMRYLKNKYPRCKFVAYWQDLVSQIKLEDFDLLKDSYLDLCLSFDQGDCSKYGLTYYPLVYSYYDGKSILNLPPSDVYFVGRAKDRLSTIIEAYELLSNAGLKCDFNITGVAKKDRVYSDKINYCNSMPYKENIEHIKATKCMLEIMQGGGIGFTLRYAEAIMYDKRMITNNSAVIEAPFYDSEKINIFKDITEIDTDFPKKKPERVDYGYKQNLLPSKMLEFIDNQLVSR